MGSWVQSGVGALLFADLCNPKRRVRLHEAQRAATAAAAATATGNAATGNAATGNAATCNAATATATWAARAASRSRGRQVRGQVEEMNEACEAIRTGDLILVGPLLVRHMGKRRARLRLRLRKARARHRHERTDAARM